MTTPSQRPVTCRGMGKRVSPFPENTASSGGTCVAPTQQSLARIRSIFQAEEHLKQTGWRVKMPHLNMPSWYIFSQGGKSPNIFM